MPKKPLHLIVAEYLSRFPGKQMTITEIGQNIASEYKSNFQNKEINLPKGATLGGQLAREIYSQKSKILSRHPQLDIDASHRPMRLFYDNNASENSNERWQTENETEDQFSANYSAKEEEPLFEKNLYEPLQRFLIDELDIVSKRIREGTSQNRRGKHGNKWLHPDIVGMMAPGEQWSDIVRQCSMEMPTRKARLIAIEVKISLTSSNLRESFFQAVSNSLWANRAYLAASEVKGTDTLTELQMLCSLHGIGYISIDPNNYQETRVMIPAREREEVDWASANRIAVENGDFEEYLSNVLNYLRTGKVMPRLWEYTEKYSRR